MKDYLSDMLTSIINYLPWITATLSLILTLIALFKAIAIRRRLTLEMEKEFDEMKDKVKNNLSKK